MKPLQRTFTTGAVWGAQVLLAALLRVDPASGAEPDMPAEAVPVAPVATPAPPKPTPGETLKKVARAVRFYGILKPTVVAVARPAESFGRPNLSAVTAAGNPALAANPTAAQLSFQVAQTRLGIWVGEGGPVRGNIEVDFIDFDKASPTTTALPRLRVATLEWQPDDLNTLVMGQTWDLSSPRMPHHFELVGANFQAGNLGFMRHQIQWLHRPEEWEVGLAVGLPGNNIGGTDGNLELNLVPTLAGRAAWKPSKAGELGVGAIVGTILAAPGERRITWAAILSGEYKPEKGPNLRGEAYIGQNSANTGMLTLSQGRSGVDVRDAGGWLSIKNSFGKHFAPYLTVGGAAVLNPDDVVPAYTAATDALPAARDGAAGPGLLWNTSARLGLEFPVIDDFALVAEGLGMVTRHRLDPADATRLDDTVWTAGGQVGGMWRF